MKAAIFPEPKKIKFVDVELPPIQEDEVLVKVRAVGVCTFEQGYFYGRSKGFPFAGGHEISGVVEKVGSAVAQKLVPGDKVIVLSLARCGECYYCRRGYDNQCENAKDVRKIPQADGPGGFAEHFLAKGYEVYRIDDDIPFETATLGEPLSCVTHSLNMANVCPGDFALVCGTGTMGALHVLLAKHRGLTVIVSEPSALRREKALEFGADYVFDPLTENVSEEIQKLTEGRGVEKAFFTAGGKAAIETAIQSLAIRGTLVIYGGTKAEDLITLDPKLFHYREITVTGVTKHTKESIRIASRLLADRSLHLERLITSRFPFEKLEDALYEAPKEASYRAVVLMEKEEQS